MRFSRGMPTLAGRCWVDPPVRARSPGTGLSKPISVGSPIIHEWNSGRTSLKGCSSLTPGRSAATISPKDRHTGPHRSGPLISFVCMRPITTPAHVRLWAFLFFLSCLFFYISLLYFFYYFLYNHF